jgi:prophage antirepressor-like protein
MLRPEMYGADKKMDNQHNKSKKREDGVDNGATDTSAPEVSNVSDAERSAFSINAWFNEKPIRIVGTADFPMFYAADIAAVLGIIKFSSSIKNFDDTEIITLEQRTHAKVATYCIRNGKPRRDDRIILLSELGVYRLIFNAKNNKSRTSVDVATIAAVKRHIRQMIGAARAAEKIKLIAAADTSALAAKVRQLRAELATLRREQAGGERLVADALSVRLGGEREVCCDVGRVDVVADGYAIEVKAFPLWKHAIGQALSYAIALDLKPAIHLFGDDAQSPDGISAERIEMVKRYCDALGVKMF